MIIDLVFHLGVLSFFMEILLKTVLKNTTLGDPWVAQWFGPCLWPREWSWGPGIKSHIRLPAWSLLLSACVSASLNK